MKLWRGQPDNWHWKPSAKEIARAWIGLGAAFGVFALYSFWFPSQSSRTGRWGWLRQPFFSAFGPPGDVVLYSAIAVAFLVFGIRKYRASRGNDVA
jgi:hypothetical protein